MIRPRVSFVLSLLLMVSVYAQTPAPIPSVALSRVPVTASAIPSLQPTVSHAPSFAPTIQSRGRFQQDFIVPFSGNTSTFFSTTELGLIQDLYANYTPILTPDADAIKTTCRVDRQTTSTNPPVKNDTASITVEYRIRYTSATVDTAGLPTLFSDFMNSNLTNVTRDLQELGLDVIEVRIASAVLVSSPAPSVTAYPSPIPSPGPTITGRPTAKPSKLVAPTIIPSLTPSILPSGKPTSSAKPTKSKMPSASPSKTFMPSVVPTISLVPTAPPSQQPTITPVPTPVPSVTRSDAPSLVPSIEPSLFPSFAVLSRSKVFMAQDFVVPYNTRNSFNATETMAIAEVFESYTVNLTTDTERVDQIDTTCAVTRQRITVDPLSNKTINSLEYNCLYQSRITNVSAFPALFFTFINSNLDLVVADMQAQGVNVTAALPATVVISPESPSPTAYPRPSLLPSDTPTSHRMQSPSYVPTIVHLPSTKPSGGTGLPTLNPTHAPTTKRGGGSKLGVGAIVGITLSAGLVGLGVLFASYRYWKRKRIQRNQMLLQHQQQYQNAEHFQQPARVFGAVSRRKSRAEASNHLVSSRRADDHGGGVVISPSESMKSMISMGESGLDNESGDEMDNTKNLQDEFDQYKDQNLEQLRHQVEGNLSGFEGIMSAAVTNALMGDDEAHIDRKELLWGCSGNPSGAEIEASALCDVFDWLKRNESATLDRKRSFMQEILGRMVSSVRYGVIGAEEAARTIHESATLLGLQVAQELPMTTVIVSGMRKTATAVHLAKVMREFGDIDVAAVASGARGFGIVRFRHPRYVNRAMQRYREGEIVLQDVAIQMKVLMHSGLAESSIPSADN